MVLSTCNAFHMYGIAYRSHRMYQVQSPCIIVPQILKIDFLLWWLEMRGWVGVLLLVQKFHKID